MESTCYVREAPSVQLFYRTMFLLILDFLISTCTIFILAPDGLWGSCVKNGTFHALLCRLKELEAGAEKNLKERWWTN